MLLYTISESEKEKFDLIKVVLDRFSMSVNPFVVETGKSRVPAAPQLGPNEHLNSEFERHRLSAQETGYPDLTPQFKGALQEIYSKKTQDLPANVTQFDPSELG